LAKSVCETDGKVVERHGSIRMTRGTECKCSLIEANGLIYVRQDTALAKSVSETSGKVVERCGLTRMTRGAEFKCSLKELNGLI